VKVAAFGRTHWLYDSILHLHERGHEIVGIATARAAPEYRVDEHDFERLARELGCVFAATVEQLPDAEIAISVNWPKLVPQSLLDRFPRGVLNAHLGDLPRFRGNAAPNWAILLGEPRVVLTVHRMDAGLDSGPILAQHALPLDDSVYIGDVYAWADKVVPETFAEALTAEPRPQEGEPLRVYPRRPEDALLDWNRSAEELARVVRASSEPFAGAFTELEGRRLVVWRAHAEPLPHAAVGIPGQVAEVREREAAVLTGDGLLVLEDVQLGAARAPAASVLTSTRLRLGG
jgi:methionyl-tRNA formyltransferase